MNARIMAFNHNTSWEAYALSKLLHDLGDDLLQELRNVRQTVEVRHYSLVSSPQNMCTTGYLPRLGTDPAYYLHRSQLRRFDHQAGRIQAF